MNYQQKSSSLLYFSVLFTNAVKLLVDIIIPSIVLNGKDALLECQYDLDDEALYSLKWYKGNEEIFRFIPGEELLSDRIKGFNLPGVNIVVRIIHFYPIYAFINYYIVLFFDY
jgi:hypothetical protein